MAYIKREKYTVIDDDNLKGEMLQTLMDKGISSVKARQLVYYPIPMSLIRWARWLEPSECSMFLVPFEETEETKEVEIEEVEETEEVEEADDMSDINFGF